MPPPPFRYFQNDDIPAALIYIYIYNKSKLKKEAWLLSPKPHPHILTTLWNQNPSRWKVDKYEENLVCVPPKKQVPYFIREKSKKMKFSLGDAISLE